MSNQIQTYKPEYVVKMNPAGGWLVLTRNKTFHVKKSQPAGTSRKYWKWSGDGKTSQYFPTLRDAIINVAYGV